MNKFALVTATLATALMATPAFADMLSFKANMDGLSESPNTDSGAKATADIKVDTAAKTISWTIKVDGLTGPATVAHFHGPAAVGANAAPVIDISKMIENGTAPITDAQLADLTAGNVYLNIHTAKFPKGEIRGQVLK